MTLDRDGKPTAAYRGLLDTAAEVSIVLHSLGVSEERIARVVRGMALAWLELHRYPIRPARAAAPARTGGEEVTEEDWRTGGA